MKLRSRGLTVLLLVMAATLPDALLAVGQDPLSEVVGLFQEQEYKEVRQILEALPEKSKRSGTALYYLGRLDLIDADHESAAKRLKEAIDVDPDNSECHYWLAVAVMRKVPYSNPLGRMTSAMRAMKEFNKAIELDPTNMRARMTVFQMMARSYGRGGAKKEALLEQARSIAEIDSIMGHVAHGTFYQFVKNDMERAGTQFERGFGLAPRNRAAAISYADYLWHVGKKAEAIGVLQSFLQEMPDDKPANFSLGARIILSRRNYGTAREIFERCLRLKSETGIPTEAMVRWCLGLIYHLTGQQDGTQTEWSRVYELDRDFDRILEATPQMSELSSILDSLTTS
ncbi:MAG: hypothetical protein AMJ46_01915 [Latescibacteria bacterium DG_63]|nr:MAG: hypothetical protein AMJ46_01915 [Latescibacteria bacterium DG_63]